MIIYLILITLGFLYFFCKKKHTFYKEKYNLDGPKPILFLGNGLDIFFDTFANYEKNNFKKYGRTYVDFLFDDNGCITTSNPEHVKKILIKDFHNFSARFPVIDKVKYIRKAVLFQNEDWKRVRTQITPVFTSGRLKLITKKFKHPIENVFFSLNEKIKSKEENKVEMKKLTKSFALDIIANVVFSLETNSYKDDIFSQKVTQLFNIFRNEFFFKLLLPPFLADLRPFRFLNNDSVDYFVKLASSLIEERKEIKNFAYNDFIEMLLKSEAEQILENADESGHIIKKLTLEEIIGQCFIFFLAGMETISTTLSYFFYELALHPDVQEKLYQDIIKNYPDDELNYDNLNNSKYLDCVINEVLRLHVTLNRVFRKTANDYDFGEFKIKKNQTVAISIFNLHHDPEIYEKPYEFKPERFQNKDSISDHLFIPFSDGPRNCIGKRFAQLEMKYFIISLMKNFKIIRNEFTQVPLVEANFVNILLFEEMFLGFQKRE